MCQGGDRFFQDFGVAEGGDFRLKVGLKERLSWLKLAIAFMYVCD